MRRSSLAWMEEVGLPSIDTETTESDAPISDNDIVLTEQELVNDIEETSAELRYMATTIRKSEYIFDRYLYLYHLYDHVTTYGVDRSFIGLANWDGVLSRDLHLRFPMATSIPSLGSPTSPLSKATIAGLEGVIGGFFKWIGDLFKKFWKWLCGLFGGSKDGGSSKVTEANAKTEAVLDGIEKELEGAHLGDNEEVLPGAWKQFLDDHKNMEIISFKKLPAYLSKLAVNLSFDAKVLPHFKASAEMLENIMKILDSTSGKDEEIAQKVHNEANTFKSQHEQALITLANQASDAARTLNESILKEKSALALQTDLQNNMRNVGRFVAILRSANEKLKDTIENSEKLGKELDEIGKKYEETCDEMTKKVEGGSEHLAKLKSVAKELKDLKAHVFKAGKALADSIVPQKVLQENIFKLAAQAKLLISTKS